MTWIPNCALCVAFRDSDTVASTQLQGVPVCGRHITEIASTTDSKAARKLRTLVQESVRR